MAELLQNSGAINAIKDQALNTLSNATGLSNDALNAGLQGIQNVSKGQNPIQTLQKAINNLANNKKAPQAIEEGIESGINLLGQPIVENLKMGVNEAAQKIAEPLTPDQITQNQISTLILARNITFGIIIFWGIVIFLRNYTTFLSEQQNEYIDKINKFMYTYSTVVILLVLIYLIFAIPINGLPYLGDIMTFFNKLNQAIQIILSSIGGGI